MSGNQLKQKEKRKTNWKKKDQKGKILFWCNNVSKIFNQRIGFEKSAFSDYLTFHARIRFINKIPNEMLFQHSYLVHLVAT